MLRPAVHILLKMTFGLISLVNLRRIHAGLKPAEYLFIDSSKWTYNQQKAFDLAFSCHYGHLLEFLVALLCYHWLWPQTFPDATTWQLGWVAKTVAFNVATGWAANGLWHWLVYCSPVAKGKFKDTKMNPANQYEKDGAQVGMFRSSSGHLEREIVFTTLGWVQSALFQCGMMHLWASGSLPFYTNFWAHPLWSVGHLLFVTYWREFHFYWCHRMIHPWWHRSNGLAQGDIGAFLYRHCHSLHHKSYNPGPWSGLSMHPVEHFFYYTCTLLPLFFQAHPLHFLYAKFHADIAPIGGHDGYEPEGGDFHWLHHARFECNYGVPLMDFDRMFGTWVDYDEFKKMKNDAAYKAKLAGNDAEAEAKALVEKLKAS